nr:SDR family NAD(P)-dependent oxidoreductase [Mesorhizobium sp. B283B1A]
MTVTYDFGGKTAIVTGGSRGIGKAVATQLIQSGADVWIWDADPLPLDGAHCQTVDVTKAHQIKDALAGIIANDRRIDILINNAGYLGSYRGFEAFDPIEWQRIIGVNLMGVFESPTRFSRSCAKPGVVVSSTWVRWRARRDCRT